MKLLAKFTRINLSGWMNLDRLLPWLVLLISLLVTNQMWRYERASALIELQTSFDFRVKDAGSLIEQKILIYEQALVGLQSFFEASEAVERGEFHNYVSKLLQAEQHQGIVAVGFSELVPEDERSWRTQEIRAQGAADYAIFPEDTAHDFYAPILFIEPQTKANLKKIGYDTYSDEVRREAMDRARDLNRAAVSSIVLFSDEADSDRRAGFLLYLPIYRNGSMHASISDKRASLAGWIFLKLDSDVLIRSTFSKSAKGLDIQIYDGSAVSESTLLFHSMSASQLVDKADVQFQTIKHLQILDHDWILVAKALPDFDAGISYWKAYLIAIVGTLISLMLMALTQLLVVRARVLRSMNTMHEKLSISEQRWKFALEGSGDGVWDWYIQPDEMHYSQRWKEILGYGVQEIQNNLKGWKSVIHPEDLPSAMSDLNAALNGKSASYINEHRVKCKDGSWKWILDRGMVVSRSPDNQVLRMVGTLTDISRLKESEEVIWSQANFDSLTGLPNRRMFYDRLEQEVKKTHRTGLNLALIFLDLDRFKEVNDTLGHDQGDILLKEASKRLIRCVRESDTVARLGGDEFIIILGDLDDAGIVERVAQKILVELVEPFKLDNEIAYVAASLGVTFYPEDAKNLDDLMKNVDQAMYAAKSLGGNRYSYFTPSMQVSAQARMQMANDLRSAIAGEQFWLVYQPIVDLKSGLITKAEALVRWQHPTRGMISPAEFIPVAEDTGLIIEIGEWVFHEAVNQVNFWRKTISKDFQISINKSPAQFHNETKLPNAWFEYIAELGLPGQSVVVEITEGLLLDANEHVTKRLLEFRDAGVQVSLDDFGTGYSSLSYLKKFDIDYLKIDKSFVANLAPGSDDLALCEAIIVMAHKLGIRVIAEGVETAVQRDLLLAAGCDFGQGYFFSRPVKAEEFERLFTDLPEALL
ncbi:MAG: EAL domain-containing protein [Candidatus Methylopumilus sp.]|jgi:diguanylate cyclase (GGDEF)-like protein/PAS domain S-box-containing protein